MPSEENVIVLGASSKPERYSNKALKMLKDHGHHVLGVRPGLEETEGIKVYPDLQSAAKEFSSVDTVTLYLSPKNFNPIVSELIGIKPKRVIMNPGTEDNEIKSSLESSGIKVEEACTLVLLSTDQF